MNFRISQLIAAAQAKYLQPARNGSEAVSYAHASYADHAIQVPHSAKLHKTHNLHTHNEEAHQGKLHETQNLPVPGDKGNNRLTIVIEDLNWAETEAVRHEAIPGVPVCHDPTVVPPHLPRYPGEDVGAWLDRCYAAGGYVMPPG